MEKNEIATILGLHFRRRDKPKHIPTELDWEDFETYFGWNADPTFRAFMELVPLYYFEGGILQVSCENGIRGEDTIIDAYESEYQIGGWDINMIPFYDIGNGDFYCISKLSNDANVYYVFHDNDNRKIISKTFEEWILQIPDY